MKKVVILILLTSISYHSKAQFNNYNNGDLVNDFTVTDVYGNVHNLYSYTASGKYVYLDFFYSICGGCQNFIPVFNEFYDKYGCNQGDIICIAINSGYDRRDEDVINFENTYGGTFNYAPAISSEGGCGTVINDFDPMYYPAKCLIAPDNIILDSDISPYETVSHLEATFPSGFNPSPMECSLGTNDYDSSFNFSVFPNPTSGNEITIVLSDNDIANVTIYTIQGKEVFSSMITELEQIIYPKLQKGVYFINLQTNRSKGTKKILIK
jgi:thiol-disulfide isomerase/thioredoxin